MKFENYQELGKIFFNDIVLYKGIWMKVSVEKCQKYYKISVEKW